MAARYCMNSSRRLLPELLAILIVAIWGMTFISTKVLINSGLLPAQIFSIIFTMAYLGIWIISLARGSGRRFFSATLKDELIFILLGLSGGSMYFLAENTALEYTQASNVSFIVCSTPLITMLLTLLLKKTVRGELVRKLEPVKVSWKLLAGTLLAIGGMALLLFSGYALKISPKGDLLAMAAALCWGLYSILMAQMTEKYGSFFATRKVFFYGLVTIIPFLLSGNEAHLDTGILIRPEVWLNLIFLGLVASLFCFICWNRVMVELGNVTATNHVYLNPIFTLIGSMIFLGEELTLLSAAGSACILAGVVLASWKKPQSANISGPTFQ